MHLSSELCKRCVLCSVSDNHNDKHLAYASPLALPGWFVFALGQPTNLNHNGEYLYPPCAALRWLRLCRLQSARGQIVQIVFPSQTMPQLTKVERRSCLVCLTCLPTLPDMPVPPALPVPPVPPALPGLPDMPDMPVMSALSCPACPADPAGRASPACPAWHVWTICPFCLPHLPCRCLPCPA